MTIGLLTTIAAVAYMIRVSARWQLLMRRRQLAQRAVVS